MPDGIADMTITELTANFTQALAAAFPDATVEVARSVQATLERVASYAAQKPLLVLCPGRREPAETLGNIAAYGGVARQSVQVWVAATGGIARRGAATLALADLVEEVESACLAADGDWTDPRWDGSDPAQLPDGYPLDAWLIRISVIKG